jgi:hypothetical protein
MNKILRFIEGISGVEAFVGGTGGELESIVFGMFRRLKGGDEDDND